MSEERAAYRAESIGYCEGLCGGLLSHHLVEGLCPICRANPRIQTFDDWRNEPIDIRSEDGAQAL